MRYKERVKDEIYRMMDAIIIEPAEELDYISPIKLSTQICGATHNSQDRSHNFTQKLKNETMQKWLANVNALINQK